jgi:hypothetical protein
VRDCPQQPSNHAKPTLRTLSQTSHWSGTDGIAPPSCSSKDTASKLEEARLRAPHLQSKFAEFLDRAAKEPPPSNGRRVGAVPPRRGENKTISKRKIDKRFTVVAGLCITILNSTKPQPYNSF